MREALLPGSPMLFLRESYRRELPEERVNALDDFLRRTGGDYATPVRRTAREEDREIGADLPLLPARGRSREGYLRELERAGSRLDAFEENAADEAIAFSANLWALRR